jgi:hypothetical protein
VARNELGISEMTRPKITKVFLDLNFSRLVLKINTEAVTSLSKFTWNENTLF